MAKATAPRDRGTTTRPDAATTSWEREGKWLGIRWAAGLRLRDMAVTYPGAGAIGPSRLIGAHELVGAAAGERSQRDIQQQLEVWESEGGAIGEP